MASIFTSYARSDAAQVLGHARQIRAAGLQLWIDQLDIETGKRWDREVEAALRACDVVLLFLSPASVASDNVLDEVSFAIDHGKQIVPVLIAPCDAPLRLRRLQHIDLTHPSAPIERVIEELRRRTPQPPDDAPPLPAPAPSWMEPPPAFDPEEIPIERFMDAPPKKKTFADAVKAASRNWNPFAPPPPLGTLDTPQTVGAWTLFFASPKSAAIYVPGQAAAFYAWSSGGELAIEVVDYSNGWWRMKTGAETKIVFDLPTADDTFAAQPWLEKLPAPSPAQDGVWSFGIAAQMHFVSVREGKVFVELSNNNQIILGPGPVDLKFVPERERTDLPGVAN